MEKIHIVFLDDYISPQGLEVHPLAWVRVRVISRSTVVNKSLPREFNKLVSEGYQKYQWRLCILHFNQLNQLIIL